MKKTSISLLGLLLALLLCTGLVAAEASTEITIEKYDAKGNLIAEKTVDYQWMEQNLPVIGDGETVYYMQGPIFEGDIWDPTESINVLEREMGPVKGTSARDLCDLVGGAGENDIITFIPNDGFTPVSLPQDVIYNPPERMGTLFLAWYNANYGYVPDYELGIIMVFTADTSVNPWGYHVFGIDDMVMTLPQEYWTYYDTKYPNSNRLSMKYVEKIAIRPGAETTSATTAAPTQALGFGILLIFASIGLGATLTLRMRNN